MTKEIKYCPKCHKNIECESKPFPRVLELDFDIVTSVCLLWKCLVCKTIFDYENACMMGNLSKDAKRIPK